MRPGVVLHVDTTAHFCSCYCDVEFRKPRMMLHWWHKITCIPRRSREHPSLSRSLALRKVLGIPTVLSWLLRLSMLYSVGQKTGHLHTYMQTNLYSAKIVETNQRRWRRVTR